jgi:hypothetical protein
MGNLPAGQAGRNSKIYLRKYHRGEKSFARTQSKQKANKIMAKKKDIDPVLKFREYAKDDPKFAEIIYGKYPHTMSRKERADLIKLMISTDYHLRSIFDLQKIGYTERDCLEIALIDYGHQLAIVGGLFPSLAKRFKRRRELNK